MDSVGRHGWRRLWLKDCEKPGVRSICSTPTTGGSTSHSSRTLRSDCAAFGSPDYYSYVAGNLKQFMDDHYIADVRKGMQGLKGKPYALFYACYSKHTAAGAG